MTDKFKSDHQMPTLILLREAAVFCISTVRS